jgi:hypothetical protein
MLITAARPWAPFDARERTLAMNCALSGLIVFRTVLDLGLGLSLPKSRAGERDDE